MAETMELSNKAKMYGNLHTIMMNHVFEGNNDAADRIAWDLLLNADLQLLIRARCHMMLSRRRFSLESVEHAREAVRILDTEIRARLEPQAFPQHQLDEAKELLQWAEEDAATLSADFVEGEESDAEDEDAEEDFAEGEAGVGSIESTMDAMSVTDTNSHMEEPVGEEHRDESGRYHSDNE